MTMDVVIVTDQDIDDRMRERAACLEEIRNRAIACYFADTHTPIESEGSFISFPVVDIKTVAGYLIDHMHGQQMLNSRVFRMSEIKVNESHIKIVHFDHKAVYLCFDLYEYDDVAFCSGFWYLNFASIGMEK